MAAELLGDTRLLDELALAQIALNHQPADITEARLWRLLAGREANWGLVEPDLRRPPELVPDAELQALAARVALALGTRLDEARIWADRALEFMERGGRADLTFARALRTRARLRELAGDERAGVDRSRLERLCERLACGWLLKG
jgi:DNA-binding Xre family transcriptional regulator